MWTHALRRENFRIVSLGDFECASEKKYNTHRTPDRRMNFQERIAIGNVCIAPIPRTGVYSVCSTDGGWTLQENRFDAERLKERKKKLRTSFSDKLYNEDVERELSSHISLSGSQQYLYSISPLVNVDMAYFVALRRFFFLSFFSLLFVLPSFIFFFFFFLSFAFHLTCFVVLLHRRCCRCILKFIGVQCVAVIVISVVIVVVVLHAKGEENIKNAPRMAAIK